MKLKVKRKNYYIKFWHSKNVGTECVIEDTKRSVLGEGRSHIVLNDQLSRPTGRKLSIARAIADAFPVDAYPDRRERRALWQAYWEERERLTGKKFSA